MNQLISFEVAKLAKDKEYVPAHPYKGSYYIDGVFTEYMAHWHCKAKEFLPCVEQSLLQKWLREEYYLWIEITLWEHGINLMIKKLNTHEVYRVWQSSRIHTTYESALEEGLQEALKLIEV